MCTGFVKKGNDIIFGFNLDIDPAVWDFDVYKSEVYFTVGIKIGKTVYFTHGVNNNACFSNLPYMNDCEHDRRGAVKNRARIDLITDRYIRGKYSYGDVLDIAKTKNVVSVPAASMHSLIADGEGHVLLLEPAYGFKEVIEDYAVITNFPLLGGEVGESPFYGKDRYECAKTELMTSGRDFAPQDGMRLLEKVKQTGTWATRLSFVYSVNENRVYYVKDGDYANVLTHSMKRKPEQ